MARDALATAAARFVCCNLAQRSGNRRVYFR